MVGWTRRERALAVCAVLLAGVVFASDLLVPLGIAWGVCYLAVVGLALAVPGTRFALACAVGCVGLVLLGWQLSPAEAPPQQVAANRGLSIAAVAALALLGLRWKRERERAAAAEHRGRAIREAALDVILAIDGEGVVVEATAAARSVFGYEPEEMVGRPLVDLVVPHDRREDFRRGRERYLHPGETRVIGQRLEFEALRKDGAVVPVEISIAVTEVHGRPLFVATARDISDRKKAEGELRRFAGELQRSNENLNEFAYAASHDLREPLRGIHNYARFLIEDYADRLDEEARRRLDTMARLTSRLDGLIERLLHYSRVARAENPVGPADLEAVLEEVLDTLEPQLHEWEVAVRVDPPLPRIVCDRARVGEVLQNFVTNAMKYNDKERRWIEIGWAAEREPAEGAFVALGGTGSDWPIFWVRDNGIGIRRQHLPSIFRIFKRLHRREDFGGGAGAGLSIARKIIEQGGGRLWVESSPGTGTVFCFSLGPLDREQKRPAAAPPGPAAAESALPSAG